MNPFDENIVYGPCFYQGGNKRTHFTQGHLAAIFESFWWEYAVYGWVTIFLSRRQWKHCFRLRFMSSGSNYTAKHSSNISSPSKPISSQFWTQNLTCYKSTISWDVTTPEIGTRHSKLVFYFKTTKNIALQFLIVLNS